MLIPDSGRDAGLAWKMPRAEVPLQRDIEGRVPRLHSGRLDAVFAD
jgi:hypothetical protein